MDCKGWNSKKGAINLDESRGEGPILIGDDNPASNGEIAVEPSVPYATFEVIMTLGGRNAERRIWPDY
jgi:hypothetical protein